MENQQEQKKTNVQPEKAKGKSSEETGELEILKPVKETMANMKQTVEKGKEWARDVKEKEEKHLNEMVEKGKEWIHDVKEKEEKMLKEIAEKSQHLVQETTESASGVWKKTKDFITNLFKKKE